MTHEDALAILEAIKSLNFTVNWLTAIMAVSLLGVSLNLIAITNVIKKRK